jgi:hypothetical protein
MKYLGFLLVLLAPNLAHAAVACRAAPNGISQFMSVQVYPTFTYTLKDTYDYEWTQRTLVQDLIDQFPGRFGFANGNANVTIRVTIYNTNGHAPFQADADVYAPGSAQVHTTASLSDQHQAATFQDPPAMLAALATKIGQRLTLGFRCLN